MAAILIVEDRIADRKELSAVLRSGGHTVIETANGAEALEGVRRTNASLIIRDILMPFVDGYELVRRVREEPELATLPVIFYTAMYHEREAKALARECGVSGIITKPSTPERILTEVTQALGLSGEPAPPPDRGVDRDRLESVKRTHAEKLAVFGAGEQRLAAIVEFAQIINAEHDSAALLTKVANVAREVAFAQHAIIGLLDQQQTTTLAVFSSGVDEAAARSGQGPLVDGSPAAAIVRERRPIRFDRPAARAGGPFQDAEPGSLM